MNKLIKNGKVAVLYSPGYGAGFETWGSTTGKCFDGEIAQAILDGASVPVLCALADRKYPDEYHSMSKVKVRWLKQGTIFRIAEYDGSESIICQNEDNWLVA